MLVQRGSKFALKKVSTGLGRNATTKSNARWFRSCVLVWGMLNELNTHMPHIATGACEWGDSVKRLHPIGYQFLCLEFFLRADDLSRPKKVKQ